MRAHPEQIRAPAVCTRDVKAKACRGGNGRHLQCSVSISPQRVRILENQVSRSLSAADTARIVGHGMMTAM